MNYKVALITGAAKRIGATIATELHHAGYNIVLHYFHSEAEAKQLQQILNQKRPESAITVNANLNQIDQLPKLIEIAIKPWQRLDVLINNASRFYPTPIDQTTEAQWDDLITVNLQAPFHLAKITAPYLKQNQGCIINIADIHGERPLKNYPIYCISKAGLIMSTKVLAKELAPHVCVNAVSPGPILWPIDDVDEKTKQHIIEQTLLKRQGSPRDIAQAVLFLAKYANYTTGQIIAVDGGRSLSKS